MTTEQVIDPRLAGLDNRQAPQTSSFMYVGRLEVEEWTFLPLEKRQRDGYVKADVAYWRVGVKPLSYTISDGGVEDDGREWTTAALTNAQGEMTPKGSARDELFQAFSKLGFPRNTVHDLVNHPATGKVFQFKRYTRQYPRKEGASTVTIPGELMNVPVVLLPDDWAPPPGQPLPDYPRKRRQSSGSFGSGQAVSNGGIATPLGPTLADVAKAIQAANVAATEEAVRAFILDRNDLAQGEILDLAMGFKLLARLKEDGLIPASA